MRVLVVSNLDSGKPFGQFTRPFYLGQALARRGVTVGNVGVDCERVDFGPAWSVGTQALRPLVGAIRVAVRRFSPDLVYAHQNLPGVASLLAAGTPVVADFHSLPSVEWDVVTPFASGGQAARYRLNAAKAAASERALARRARLPIAAGGEVAEVLSVVHRPSVAPVVVGNGAPDSMFHTPRREAAPAALGAPGRHAVATIPAEASPSNERSLLFVREVAGTLARRSPDVQVHILGSSSGPEAPNLHYQGFQPDLLAWLDHADVSLLPYPYDARTCGGARNKLLEALARAPRVVSTREGMRGVGEAVGWPGVHLAPDDPEGFAATVADAVRDQGRTLADSRAQVEARLSWDALGGQLLGHLNAAL